MPTIAPRSTEEIEDTLERAAASAGERLRRKKARQSRLIALAVLAALLLHLLLIPLIGWGMSHWPRKPLPKGNAPFHLSLTRSDEEPKNTAAPLKPSNPQQYIRTNEEQVNPDVTNPDFISDKDTRAASELPPTDPSKPLPTLQGREIPSYDFDTRPYRPGKEAANAATAASTATEQATAAVPNQTPRPDVRSKTPDSQSKTRPRAAAPTPSPMPNGELASLQSQPTPANEPPHPDETPSDTPPPPMTKASNNPPTRPNQVNSVNSPGQKHPPGYQPQTMQSKMSGSISNRGIAAVTAQSTPLGRYQKGVEDAIGSMWYIEVERQMSFLVHTSEVKLHFYITRSGRVRSVRVSGGDSNSTLASLSVGAVTEAEIAPIPPDVSEMLPGGELEMDMGFEFYIQ